MVDVIIVIVLNFEIIIQANNYLFDMNTLYS